MLKPLVEQRLKILGWSKSHLARLAGMSPQQLNNILSCRRKNPSASTIYRIAQALEMDASSLIAASAAIQAVDEHIASQLEPEPLTPLQREVVDRLSRMSTADADLLLDMARRLTTHRNNTAEDMHETPSGIETKGEVARNRKRRQGGR